MGRSCIAPPVAAVVVPDVAPVPPRCAWLCRFSSSASSDTAKSGPEVLAFGPFLFRRLSTMGTLVSIESQHAGAAQRAAFDGRYGDGSFDELLRRLGQPCISFAQIASHFGVTRERVRQWHRQWLPDAPTGLQRRRLCAAYQDKRRLMLDPLFRAFHREARASIGAERIHPVAVARAASGRRTVRIDRFVIALRDAVTSPPRYRGRADFIYFRLAGDEFLFVASADQITTHPRNTFAALDARSSESANASFTAKEQSL